MATTTYASVFGDIMANVPGVPDAVLQSYMNKVTIDLCERAKVWRVNYAPVTLLSGNWNQFHNCTCSVQPGYVCGNNSTSTCSVNSYTLVPGTYTYTVTSPIANTELSDVLLAKVFMGSSALWRETPSVTTEQIFHVSPAWPDVLNPGQPTAVTRVDETSVSVVPVPDNAQTYTLYMYCAIRPTLTATGVDSTIYDQYRRAIYHGVLHELMMMPKRPWTDEKRAEYHGKQWEFFIAQARARANKSFGRANISVVPSPWA